MMCGPEQLTLGLACLCSLVKILSRTLVTTGTAVLPFLYDGQALHAQSREVRSTRLKCVWILV